MYFLGIDSGTQSTKSVVLDLDSGAIVAHASQPYDTLPGLAPGHLEQEPLEWKDAVLNTIEDCLNQLGAKKTRLRGIGVSGQQHGLVVLDSKDEVVRPAKLWCDTSTVDQCEQIASQFGGQDQLINLAGNAALPGYTMPKILWLKQNEPENFAKVASILLPHDYINFFLTGVKRMEYGDASGMGFLNIRTRKWATEIMDFIDPAVQGMLPELGSSLEKHGLLCNELKKRWGLTEDVVVSAGGGDNMMGAIGTGNIKPGVITASFGTSGTLYGVASEPIIDPKGEIAAFCDSADQWMPLVCTMNVTVVSEQVRKLFSWEFPAFEEAISSAAPGADGISFLPYLNGERTPNLPNGSGVLHGLRTDNMTQENLGRAAVEGATLGLAYGMNRFRELNMSPSEIRLTGGGSNSATWRQIAADAFDASVVSLATAEGAGLGGAVQAAYIWHKENGEKISYEDLCAKTVQLDESTRCEPKSETRDLYQEKLATQTRLTETLRDAGLL